MAATGCDVPTDEQVLVAIYTPHDHAAVCALWREADMGTPHSDQFASEMASGGIVLLARFGSTDHAVPVCGSVALVVERRHAIVSHLVVAPWARRRGIATLLMRRLEQRARSAGIKMLYLYCLRDNAPAAELYLREGWTLDRLYNGPLSIVRPILVRLGLRRPPLPGLIRWRKKLSMH